MNYGGRNRADRSKFQLILPNNRTGRSSQLQLFNTSPVRAGQPTSQPRFNDSRQQRDDQRDYDKRDKRDYGGNRNTGARFDKHAPDNAVPLDTYKRMCQIARKEAGSVCEDLINDHVVPQLLEYMEEHFQRRLAQQRIETAADRSSDSSLAVAYADQVKVNTALQQQVEDLQAKLNKFLEARRTKSRTKRLGAKRRKLARQAAESSSSESETSNATESDLSDLQPTGLKSAPATPRANKRSDCTAEHGKQLPSPSKRKPDGSGNWAAAARKTGSATKAPPTRQHPAPKLVPAEWTPEQLQGKLRQKLAALQHKVTDSAELRGEMHKVIDDHYQHAKTLWSILFGSSQTCPTDRMLAFTHMSAELFDKRDLIFATTA